MLSVCNIQLNMQVRGSVDAGGFATGTPEDLMSFDLRLIGLASR